MERMYRWLGMFKLDYFMRELELTVIFLDCWRWKSCSRVLRLRHCHTHLRDSICGIHARIDRSRWRRSRLRFRIRIHRCSIRLLCFGERTASDHAFGWRTRRLDMQLARLGKAFISLDDGSDRGLGGRYLAP
jgi:hypothetical protein